MTDQLPPESRHLLSALVDVYPTHVRSRLGDRRIDGLEEAIEEGRAWLEQALADLLSQPFADQRRGPLEVFQEAMRFPTEALAAVDEPPAARDPVVEGAIPGDVYDLAPASTRDLGEDVWRLHLMWGAAKAAAFRGSRPPEQGGGGR